MTLTLGVTALASLFARDLTQGQRAMIAA